MAGNSQSTSDMVYEAIKADILNFRIRPGELLAEEALSRQFEVSRTPVRDALRRLEHEGLSESKGRSRVVRVFNLASYEGIYRVRIALEDLAVDEAISSASDELINELAETWAGKQPIAQIPLDGTFVYSDERFHVGVASLAGNDYLVRTLRRVNDRIRAMRRVDFTTRARIKATAEEHAEILRLIQDRDRSGAQLAMGKHIQKSQQKIRARLPELVAKSYLDTNDQPRKRERGRS
jgi:DNA-binding GntR family transcriptional regulator